jgi:tryptophanyl-tRNA synthetase
MCADIIIHNADKVPVGKDQEQNLEMARRFARRFNNMYNVEYFKMPEPYNFGDELIKVPGLDGTGKMGKSEGNGIYLADDPSVIRKKVMRAVTDAGPEKPDSPMSEPVENLFYLLQLMSGPDTVGYFREQYSKCTIRYGDLKKQLAEDIIAFTTPIRERINEIYHDDAYLRQVVRTGAERARESAGKTLKDVREIMGFKSF